MGSRLTHDYEALEQACLFKGPGKAIGDIYIHNVEEDTYYLVWKGRTIRISANGKYARWEQPAGKPVHLKPIGGDDWVVTGKRIQDKSLNELSYT